MTARGAGEARRLIGRGAGTRHPIRALGRKVAPWGRARHAGRAQKIGNSSRIFANRLLGEGAPPRRPHDFQAADEGRKDQVKVNFIDDAGTAEMRTSTAYPAGTVTVAAALTACPAPVGRTRVWTGTVTVEAVIANGNQFANRYRESLNAGDLSDRTVDVDADGTDDYTVDTNAVAKPTSTSLGTTEGDLPIGFAAALGSDMLAGL